MQSIQGLLDKNIEERITIDSDDLEIADRLSYFGNVLSAEKV